MRTDFAGRGEADRHDANGCRLGPYRAEPDLPQDGGSCGALSRAIDVATLFFAIAIVKARTTRKGTHD